MSLWIIAERNDSKVYLYCRRGICDLMIMRRYHDITNLLTTPEATLHYCSQHRPATLWLNVLHSASAAASYDVRLSHTRTHSPSLSYTLCHTLTHARTHTHKLSLFLPHLLILFSLTLPHTFFLPFPLSHSLLYSTCIHHPDTAVAHIAEPPGPFQTSRPCAFPLASTSKMWP